METWQRIAILAAGLSGRQVDSIGPTTPVGENGLDLDSLDKLTFVQMIEDEFHIQISDDEADKPELATIGGLTGFVQDKIDERGDQFEQFGVAIEGAQSALGNSGVVCIGQPPNSILVDPGAAGAEHLIADAFDQLGYTGQDVASIERALDPLSPADVRGTLRLIETVLDQDLVGPMRVKGMPPDGVLSGTTLMMLTEQAKISARRDAKTIFEAGWEARRNYERLGPTGSLEEAWNEFAQREGLDS